VYVVDRPADYNALFDKVLEVVGAFFKVDYANRYDGRIETAPAFIARAPGAGSSKPNMRRRALVQVMPAADGTFTVEVRVLLEEEVKATKVGEARWELVERDTDVERRILERLAAKRILATNDSIPVQKADPPSTQPTPTAKTDREKIQGVWKVETMASGGI